MRASCEYYSPLLLLCTFYPAPVRLFSRSRLRGTHGALLSTGRMFGSRAGPVARALGVQSRQIWQVLTGLLSAELLEPSKTMENPYVSHGCKAQQHDGNNNRFKPSSVLQLRTQLLCVCGPLLFMYACMSCVCSVYVCPCESVHDDARLLSVGKDNSST